MATYIFQKIADQGRAQGFEPGSEDSRDWLRDQAMSVSSVNTQALMRKEGRMYNNLSNRDIGGMYMFFYDPKHKETLPFYDRFPLIFMIEKYNDGFLGMNLHYLPHLYRARLMDSLYNITMNDNVRDSKKLRLSYSILKSAAKFRYFKPCVKRYLTNHVKSRFLWVPYEEWDVALMLPTERFQKSKKANVWTESKKNIGR